MGIKLTVTKNQMKLVALAASDLNVVNRDHHVLTQQDSDDLTLLDDTFTKIADKIVNLL